MKELYPPPAPPKPKAEEKEKEKETEKAAPDNLAAAVGETAAQMGRPNSSFGGGKGTVFLVSVKTREVLWSIYERPKDSRPATLERTAGRISSELKKSISAKDN
jgi:hypothetical protein